VNLHMTRIESIEHKTERSQQHLLILNRISDAIIESMDLDSILHLAMDSILETMGGVFGGILIVNEKSQTASYRICRSLVDSRTEEACLKIGKGIANRVIKNGKIEQMERVSTDTDSVALSSTNLEGLKVFLCMPLKANESVLGALTIVFNYPHTLTKDDTNLIQAVGDRMALAIERDELYSQLQKIKERYQKLTQNIVAAQEEERKRIARELHDETSQTLSGLTCSLQVLVEIAESSAGLNDAFIAQVKKAQSVAVRVGDEISRLMYELRPTLLDTLGLVPAIRQYAEDMLRPLGINVTLQCKGKLRAVPPEVEVGLFRIAQSSIGNIIKHANARNVMITLEYDADHVSLYIRDDGKGFDVYKLEKVTPRGKGSGVFGMKERVELLGGHYSVKSMLGQGTTVSVKLPLTWSSSNEED
jgi:signal transduction histidine kinase